MSIGPDESCEGVGEFICVDGCLYFLMDGMLKDTHRLCPRCMLDPVEFREEVDS